MKFRILFCGVLLAVGCGNSDTFSNSQPPIPAPTGGPRIARQIFHDDTDGQPDIVVTWNYDGAGNLVSRSYDFGNDGTIELQIPASPNVNPQLTAQLDGNDDGLLDSYRETSPGVYELDDDRDGDVDSRYLTEDNSDGSLKTVRLDSDADGTPDWQVDYEYLD